MPKLKKTMFREYDIRGMVEEDELSKENIKIIAKGFATFLKNKDVSEIVVGYDAREYSEGLYESMIEGLLESGINIVRLGMVTTPMVYWAQYHLEVKGCAMITASHNPNGWTGFKLGYGFSKTLLPEDIKELYQIIETDNFLEGEGSSRDYEDQIVNAYTEDVLGRVNVPKKLKVVVDCGNGTPGPIYSEALEKAGYEVTKLFCDIDMSFPNHEPNPSDVNALKFLQDKVKEVGADVGVAFDGDGDRLGVVDNEGNIIGADKFLIPLSRRVLEENPEGSIVFDVKCSQALPEDIENHGGNPVMWKTGHSYIKKKCQEVNAVLAGEKSGHIFYAASFYPHDDALYASLKLLEYLGAQENSFNEVMKTIPHYVTTSTIHVNCADEVKYEVVEKLVQDFKEQYGEEKVIDINGARVVFEHGWGLVRASSNMPVLVMVFESKTEEGLEEIKSIFKEKLESHPEVTGEWHFG